MERTKVVLDGILAKSLVVILSILLFDVLWQVFSRYVLKDPSSFTDELARFLLIWVSLLGASFALSKKMHLAIDILPEKFTGNLYHLAQKFILLCIGLFCFFVMVLGGIRLVYITLLLEQKAPALQVPLGYVYLVLPLSGIVMIFYVFYFWFETALEKKS